MVLLVVVFESLA